jgi:hypothetical protein
MKSEYSLTPLLPQPQKRKAWRSAMPLFLKSFRFLQILQPGEEPTSILYFVLPVFLTLAARAAPSPQ